MRTKKGYMLINEKKHFVYDGLNIIGRQKGATVIIPDTSVSHYQSTIVIIEDRHYLSDISSSNGTYLRELRLNPLQLYQLNTGNNLKFGLVKATYFKFTNGENNSLEGEASQPVQFDEGILNVGTQICDIGQTDEKSEGHITGKPNNNNSQKLTSNLQAEFFGDHNDEELELVAGEIENSFNLDEISDKPSSSTNNILINDLPTQIFCSSDGNETAEESDISSRDRSSSINHVPIHDLPTQIIISPINETKTAQNDNDSTSIHNLPTQLILPEKENETEEKRTNEDATQLILPEDGLDNSLADISNDHQTSTNIIEETITTNDVDDDGDSRESTDFLTMQPVATQHFNSDPQSQLFLENLKRRVKYVIYSSDDDSDNLNRNSNEKSQENNTKKTTLQKDKSSDEETECEFSQIKMKKLTKTKPVFNSDSDDSTDAEESFTIKKSKVIGSNKTNDGEDDGSSTDSDLDIPLAQKVINITTATKDVEQTMLDDSDIIPTTQSEAPNNNSATATLHVKTNQESKIKSQILLHDNNFEASLEESFCLHLTNTQRGDIEYSKDIVSKDKNPLGEPQTNTEINDSTDIFVEKIEKPTIPDHENKSNSKNAECDTNSIPHTQLEVIFDDSNLPEETNNRPENPLLNVLDAVNNTKPEDSVEDKLEKMFQSQVDPALTDKDIVVQHTRVTEPIVSVVSTTQNDIFLVPTQTVINKIPETPSKNSTNTLDAPAGDKAAHSDDEDIFLQPTQVMASEDSAITRQKCTETTLRTEKDEDIFLQPTQVVCTTSSDTNLKDSETTEKLSDDVFMQPTQILSNDKQPNVNSRSSSSVVLTVQNSEKDNTATDIFLQPTQIVSIDKQQQPPNTISENRTNSTESNNTRKDIPDDIFLQPTQVLCNNTDLNTISNSTATITDTKNIERDSSSEDTIAIPAQMLTTDKPSTIVSSGTITTQKEVEETEQRNIADEIFLKTAREVNSKSDRLTNFLHSISIQSSDSDTSAEEHENDSNLKKKTKSARATRTNKSNQEPSTSTGKTLSKRNANKQQNAETKNVKASGDKSRGKSITLKQKRLPETKQPPLHSESDSTDGEDASITNNRSSSNTLPDATEKTASNGNPSEEYDANTKIDRKKKANEPPIDDDVTGNKTVTAKRTSRRSPMIDLRPSKKTGQVNKIETINEMNDKNKSLKPRNKMDKTEDNSSDNDSKSFKLSKEDISKPVVDKTEKQAGVSSESRSKGRKTKAIENEDNLPTKKKKIGDSPIPVVSRRSTRKKSTEEKTTNPIGSGDNLKVIEEISTPPEHGETTSEDEFVQANQATPSRTQTRLKQTPSSRNQKIRESVVQNKRRKPKQLSIMEDNTADSNEPLPSSSTSTSDNNSVRKSEKNKAENEPSTTASPTLHSGRLQPETHIKKNEPQQELENKTPVSTRRTRKTKAEDKEEPPLDANKNESDMLARTSKRMRTVPKYQSHLSEEEGKSSSPIMLARRSRKFKTDEVETEQQQNSSEYELSCPSVSSSNADTRCRNSRKRRSPSKTSEDDFEVTKVQIGKTSMLTVPPTPERTKRILKPKVIFTMLDSPELETIIRSLGGFVVDSIEKSTVLITGSVKRSQKLLSAVGLAKPICSPKWLHESKRANHFLDPWDYILEDEEAEIKWNFSLKESLRRSSASKLLANYTFQIMVNAAHDVLKGSIESCGGKCVTRAPAKGQQTNFVIVASPENRSKYARFLKQNPPPQIIAPEAIFDGVLRQELHFENHMLS